MTFLNSVFSWIIKKRIHQIELFIKYPHEVQQELFHKLIKDSKNTEWGKKYDYNSINTVEDFKKRIPLQDYEDVKPFVDRLRKGEQNILWPSEIKWFAKSSGTTSDRSKYIPVSKEAIEECHFKAGKDMLAIYCNNYPDHQLFNGKGLMMGGSHQVDQTGSGSYVGDLSAILIQNLPLWARLKNLPDSSIALMEQWEKKIEKIADATIDENITGISGVPSWTLVLINYILKKTGKDNLLEVWPELELFMHGGVSFTPYKEQFKKLIPSSGMHYLETYNASEGFFGIQDQRESDEMLLMLDYGVYYEFIPIEELEKEQPETLSLHQVETGKIYALVISTNAGLWRYKIGDTITFTSLSPFRIKISGRTKHFINAFGEELIIENAENALSEACSITGAEVKDYTGAPVYFNDQSSGAHEWLIEFTKEPDSMDKFVEAFDQALRKVNSDYDAKRTGNMVLRQPLVKIVPQGTFYNWLKSKGKLGGQNKVPRLSNNRKYIDEISSFSENAVV